MKLAEAEKLITFACTTKTTNLPYFLSICKLSKIELNCILFAKRQIRVSSHTGTLADFGVTSNVNASSFVSWYYYYYYYRIYIAHKFKQVRVRGVNDFLLVIGLIEVFSL